MGQAKQRGTFEQRKAAAIEKRQEAEREEAERARARRQIEQQWLDSLPLERRAEVIENRKQRRLGLTSLLALGAASMVSRSQR